MLNNKPGIILAIGGAPSVKLLKQVVTFSGGAEATIAVITHANEAPQKVGALVQEDFLALGAGSVRVILPTDNSADAISALASATGVYMTGGCQSRLMRALRKQTLVDHVLKAHRRGVFICGNSAGAAALVTTMIAGGMEPGNRFIRRDALQFAPGLGLLKNLKVDTHVDYYGRALRLYGQVAVEIEPVVGIDEDTGIIVQGNRAKVVGHGYVSFVRRGQDFCTNVGTVGSAKSARVENLLVSVFTDGDEFEIGDVQTE